MEEILGGQTWHWVFPEHWRPDKPGIYYEGRLLKLQDRTGVPIMDFGDNTTYYPTNGTEPPTGLLGLIAACPDMYRALKTVEWRGEYLLVWPFGRCVLLRRCPVCRGFRPADLADAGHYQDVYKAHEGHSDDCLIRIALAKAETPVNPPAV